MAERRTREDLSLPWTRYLRLLAWASGIGVCALLVALLLGRSDQLNLHTPAGWQSASALRLPDNLQFAMRQGKIALVNPYPLAGRLASNTRSSTNNLTILEATLSGRTRDGWPVSFRGTLVLTNAPGVAEVRGRGDFVGARLSGELIVGTNAPVLIEQPYFPE